ncbi:MAG: hypothetical protein RL095_2778 [Verrucomicrobiota bacterium]|jgi:tRNA-2-methylthio-N6-dimethylallyladenosine synthase
MSESAKKVLIHTYGCQMNDRDSEAVAMDLKAQGFELTEEEKDADVILFNTCSVRDQAERKAMGKIGLISRLKRRKPELRIGVLGCMAQSRSDELIEKFDHVDFVVGTDQLHRVPEMLRQVESGAGRLVEIGLSRDILERLAAHPAGEISAQVSIQRGCNEYCTYCIVPFTRGQEKSRPAASILAEIRGLADRGVREVTLLGQNITAYGLLEARRERSFDPSRSPFAELLRAVAAIPGIRRIRFTSPHARYFNQDLIDTIAAEPKICRGINFPLQSGSDSILKLMRRRYTAAEYLGWVRRVQEKVPEALFCTDLIVGFPGETEADFEATRKLCEEVGFDQSFIFRYSPRKDTPAARMSDQVPEEVMERRQQLLMDDLNRRLERRNSAMVGSVQEVLVEGPSKRNPERWSGRSTHNKIVIFDPLPGLTAGTLASIKIERSTLQALYGDCVGFEA